MKKRTDEELKKLWADFHSARAEKPLDDIEKEERRQKQKVQQARNRIIEAYYYLVPRIAEKMATKLKDVSVDDLASFGVDGLFHAVDHFKPEMGNKFQTYAVPRIRGSILDNIRQIDWVPRLVRQRASKIEKTRQALESAKGRAPTDAEMASHLKLSLEDYTELKKRAIPVGCISIHSKTNEDGESDVELSNLASRDEDPLRLMVKDEFFKKVMGKGFTRIEREIIALHYYDNMTMKEIADMKSFSESRISQMHAAIMKRLEQKVERIPKYISGIEEALS